MLPTTIYCPSMSFVAYEEEGFALFHLFHLFKVVSGSSILYDLYWDVPLFTSDDFTHNVTCKFTINQLHPRFYYRVGKVLSQSEAAFMYYKLVQVLLQSEATFLCYKAGQVVLQIRAGIKKWGNFYYKVRQVLQSGTTFITKWGNYYKVASPCVPVPRGLLREMGESNSFCQPAPWLTFDQLVDGQFIL